MCPLPDPLRLAAPIVASWRSACLLAFLAFWYIPVPLESYACAPFLRCLVPCIPSSHYWQLAMGTTYRCRVPVTCPPCVLACTPWQSLHWRPCVLHKRLMRCAAHLAVPQTLAPLLSHRAPVTGHAAPPCWRRATQTARGVQAYTRHTATCVLATVLTHAAPASHSLTLTLTRSLACACLRWRRTNPPYAKRGHHCVHQRVPAALYPALLACTPPTSLRAYFVACAPWFKTKLSVQERCAGCAPAPQPARNSSRNIQRALRRPAAGGTGLAPVRVSLPGRKGVKARGRRRDVNVPARRPAMAARQQW